MTGNGRGAWGQDLGAVAAAVGEPTLNTTTHLDTHRHLSNQWATHSPAVAQSGKRKRDGCWKALHVRRVGQRSEQIWSL